jgi:hypothetical protein
VRGRVLLPHAKTRLDWHNRKRLALFSRRFSPATCCTLDNGSLLRFEDDRLVSTANAFVITRSGQKRVLTPR